MDSGPKSENSLHALEVGFVSSEPARIMDFYTRAFGFGLVSSFSSEAGTVYKLRYGEARIKIFAPATEPQSTADEPLGSRQGICYLSLYISDVDQSLSRAIEEGATVLIPPVAHRPGASMSLIRDPTGNIVELLQDPSAL